jgi:tetratricopeptide (TPR) repeat protein
MESAGEMMLAYSYYTYAYRHDPGNAQIELALARVALELGKMDEARGYANSLLSKEKYVSSAKLVLAEVEYEARNRDRALELLESVADNEDVPRFEVYRFIARIQVEKNDPAAARAALEKARELDPGDLFVNYRLGLLYADEGNREKAVESLREAIRINPGFSGSYLALGSVLLHYGDEEGAMAAYEGALELDPGNRTAVGDLSRLYYEAGRYEDGVSLLEPLYEQRKLGENGKMILGRFYYRTGRSEDALTVFRALLATIGERPQVMRAVAEIEMELGNLRTASEYLERLVEIEPDLFNNYIGLVLISNGLAGEPSSDEEDRRFSSVEGTNYLRQAVSRMDRSAFYDNYIIGTVFRKNGDLEMAEKYLASAERIVPDDRGVLLELAALYEDQEKIDDALSRVRTAYGNEPQDPSINNFYGYLLAVKGDSLDLAEQLISRALDDDPANGYFLDSLGWVKFKKGEFSEALEILLSASEIVEDDPVIWEHIGDTYMKLGQPELAFESYSRSAEVEPGRRGIDDKMRQARNATGRPD